MSVFWYKKWQPNINGIQWLGLRRHLSGSSPAILLHDHRRLSALTLKFGNQIISNPSWASHLVDCLMDMPFLRDLDEDSWRVWCHQENLVDPRYKRGRLGRYKGSSPPCGYRSPKKWTGAILHLKYPYGLLDSGHIHNLRIPGCGSEFPVTNVQNLRRWLTPSRSIQNRPWYQPFPRNASPVTLQRFPATAIAAIAVSTEVSFYDENLAGPKD